MTACSEVPRMVIYHNCGCFEPVARDGKTARVCPHGNKGVFDDQGWKIERYCVLSNKTVTRR